MCQTAHLPSSFPPNKKDKIIYSPPTPLQDRGTGDEPLACAPSARAVSPKLR